MVSITKPTREHDDYSEDEQHFRAVEVKLLEIPAHSKHLTDEFPVVVYQSQFGLWGYVVSVRGVEDTVLIVKALVYHHSNGFRSARYKVELNSVRKKYTEL